MCIKTSLDFPITVFSLFGKYLALSLNFNFVGKKYWQRRKEIIAVVNLPAPGQQLYGVNKETLQNFASYLY